MIPPNANDFPSIRPIISATNPLKCMSPTIAQQARPCKKPINMRDRAEASALQKQLFECSSAEDALPLTQKIQELCLCKGPLGHQKLFQGSQLQIEVSQRWLGELGFNIALESIVGSESNPSTENTSTVSHQREASSTTSRQAGARYNLRPSTIATRPTLSVPRPQTDLVTQEFEPHKHQTRESLVSVLLRPLPSKSERKRRSPSWETGSLYCLSRDSSPGMLKIGLTTRTVAERVNEIARNCEWNPEVVLCVENVPHIGRAELLVHFELLPYWRKERRCKSCTRAHQEWFETDKDTAAKSMKSFAEWLRVAEPYNQVGYLKSKWRALILDMEKRGVPVTSQSLLDSFNSSEELKCASETDTLPTLRSNIEPTVRPSRPIPSAVSQDVPSNLSVPLAETLSQLLLSMQQMLVTLNASNRHRFENNSALRSMPSIPVLVSS